MKKKHNKRIEFTEEDLVLAVVKDMISMAWCCFDQIFGNAIFTNQVVLFENVWY